MRHRVDELADEIILPALHQRRHGDREADPDGDPEYCHKHLPTAASDVCRGDVDDERHFSHSFGAAAIVTRAPSLRAA
jgi:hypothetical protein